MNQAKQKRQAAQQAFREALNQLDNILGDAAIDPPKPKQPPAETPKQQGR
jgi:outer membrane protein TolC